VDGAYNPGWIYRSSRTAPPPRCPPAAHWNNPVPFRSSLLLRALSLPLVRLLHRLPPSISFSHRVPSIGLLRSPLSALFRSSVRLPFSVLFTTDSPFDSDPPYDSGISPSLSFAFFVSVSLVPLSFSVGLITLRVRPRRANDPRFFVSLFLPQCSFFHREQRDLSLLLPVPYVVWRSPTCTLLSPFLLPPRP